MTISVAATSAAVPLAPTPAVRHQASAPAVVAQSSAASGSTSAAQQRAALNQLLAKYKYDMTRNVAPSALASLGRQIFASAKAAGQRVTLPRATAGAEGAATPAAAEAPSALANQLKITA
jgi:hypothetical protein